MCSDLVPLSIFELDCPEPPAGWAQLFESENVELTEDDIGRVCINREDARRLLGALRAEEAYRADERRRREAERERQMAEFAARHPVPRGIPAQPGMSAVEVMFAADADEREPSVFTRLLDEELAHGKRG
jgi:hypothetical protein